MTGYASVQCATPNSAGTTIGIELRAVNSRFLDITFKMPDEWRAVELPMRQLLGRHVQRGKLELRGFCRLDQGPRAPDNTGITAINKNAVINHVQTNNGIFIRVIPGARRFRMVAMILMAPMMEEIPMMCTPKIK